MPMPTADLLYPLDTQSLSVALEPAQNIQHMLFLLSQADHVSGFDDWVYRTAAAMTPEERITNDVVMVGLHYIVTPRASFPSFPAFIENLAAEAPVVLRNRLLDNYIGKVQRAEGTDETFDYDEILADIHAFLAFLRRGFPAEYVLVDIERRAYTYLLDPPAMRQLIVEHFRSMWYKYLAIEWERVRPMLQKAVRAFEASDLSSMNRLEAAEYIIGRDVEGEHWFSMLSTAERVVFIPSAHVGPYTAKCRLDHSIGVIFGARQPENTLDFVPELSRAELLVRLNALADDTRLSILKLVADQGEQRSQDIMQLLDLSQSGTSRHLQQLTAAGFLNERRCNGAKCYHLNGHRIESTLRELDSYLSPVAAFSAA